MLSGLFILTAAGCFKMPHEKLLDLSEADQKFLQICREEYKINVVTKSFAQTLWVYAPFPHEIISLKASENEEAAPNEPKLVEKYLINYINGEFKDKTLSLDYDINYSKNYTQDYGFSNQYTDEYKTLQRNILTALSRAYSEAQKPPSFLVIITADIIRGIRTKMIVYFPDLKRAMTDAAFTEEYTRRAVAEYPRGDPQLLGNETGENLDFHEITWREFLAKQIIFRVQTKYQLSSFAPNGKPVDEILKITAETFQAYNFTDFHSIVLHDLKSDSTVEVNQSQLINSNN